MARKLFCEISPLAYRISAGKEVTKRYLSDGIKTFLGKQSLAEKRSTLLPAVIYEHQSLIRRKLGDADPVLQENKAVNLSLAAPKVDGILIRPGETFSFWHLVGSCTEKKGYKEGLTIRQGVPQSGIGGGMCQFTNLIHWMVLHSPLTVVEHHHHDGVDLFPDFGRKVPFGTGTSILWNYKDYRFYNDTDQTFQLSVRVTDRYLCGELRAERKLPHSYHIRTEEEFFTREADGVYRCGEVIREVADKRTGQILEREVIKKNHAKVLYDPLLIGPERFR
ncbi:MAG: VanW family protein [Oscillospiraceae bacterium]|nr:VanW family protein [Oscillospiraceae bacterium]